jgi:acyl-CoA synthetase (AMP-forming)/AMP-acid ligase II
VAATLFDLLRKSAGQFGNRPAVIMPDTQTPRVITYAQLLEESTRVAQGLRRLGLRRGDAMALWLPNVPEWLVLEFAAAAVGLLVIGLNTRYRVEEAAGAVTAARIRCLVIQPTFLSIDFLSMAESVRLRAPDLERVVELPAGYESLADRHTAVLAPEARPEDPVNVFTTSGTTAAPKLAVHDNASIVQHAYADAQGFEITPQDVMLCVLPLCGVFGFSSVMAALAAGASCVLQVRFEASQTAEVMARYGVTHLNGTDAMLHALLRIPGFDYHRLRRLRVGGFADFGGRLREALGALEERVGTPLRGLGGTYGSSELFALLSRWRTDHPISDRARGGGRLVSQQIQVRCVDPRTGRAVQHGDPGELQFRGYPVMAYYLNNPGATAEAMAGDGWLRSGDLGYTLDETTFVYLARMKDSLRLSGFLVDPREIEEFLEGHGAVEAAQVVGIPSEPGGEVPVAFVRQRPGTTCTPAELISYCRPRIAEYKVPKHVFFVETFPTTPSANGDKIQKAKLREMAVERLRSITPPRQTPIC